MENISRPFRFFQENFYYCQLYSTRLCFYDFLMSTNNASLEQEQVTWLLQAWKSGDADAREKAMNLLYTPLCKQAGYLLMSQREGATLTPTALVNELFIRLDKADFDAPSRYAFRALSGRAMRNVLISHVRKQSASKRAGKEITVNVGNLAETPPILSAETFLDLNNAMDQLKVLDDRCHQLCEGHYFAGLTYPQLAELFDISEATVTRDLRFARAWLKSKLSNELDHAAE